MDTEQAKQFISQAKNIYIIPDNKSREAIVCALALFYTLKELDKNVNLLEEDSPEALKFLLPSLDFITIPKNFVISVPSKVAEISQIYYEKNDDNLKIHLTVNKGNIKKEGLSFYFSEPKPDLLITFGIEDLAAELQGRLNPYGFLLDSPVLNIDNRQNNKKFGRINLVEDKPMAELSISLIKALGENLVKEKAAACLLSGLVLYTENFKNKVTADIFEIAGKLMKIGADIKEITDNIYK